MKWNEQKPSHFSTVSLEIKSSTMHAFLLLTGALCILEANSFFPAGKRRFAKQTPHRVTREIGAPAPIDCLLSQWSEWGPCNPCGKERYRSRSVLRYGQFGGKPCFESLGDKHRCVTDKACPEEVDCGNDFRCENGQCIKQRLVCNTEDDCGDFSDEDNCDDANPRPPCRDRVIDVSEIGRKAGRGLNILGMQPKDTPFYNEFYNGQCNRERDGNTGIYYRKPWNVATLHYETKGDKSYTVEEYENQVTVVQEMFSESVLQFKASLSLKLNPTEIIGVKNPSETEGVQNPSETEGVQNPSETEGMQNPSDTEDTVQNPSETEGLQNPSETVDKTQLKFSVGVSTSFGSYHNLSHFFKESNEKAQTFLRVKGSIELGTFQMRSRDLRLTDTFLDDIKYLPTDYDMGEYFKFLETHGTHYAQRGTVGGKYELLYVFDNQTMREEGVTVENLKSCLESSHNFDFTIPGVQFNAERKKGSCDKNTLNKDKNKSGKAVITSVISQVHGGKTDILTELKEKLSKDAKLADPEDYARWAATLSDAPAVIEKQPHPISTLVPVKLPNSYIKKQNLDRAVEDYVAEYSVCKCQPCQNGGTVVLVNGECICGCSPYFKGVACQIPKSPLEPAQGVTHGGWSCWSGWSACGQGERTRTRQCNNPAPGPGGEPCAGTTVETGYC